MKKNRFYFNKISVIINSSPDTEEFLGEAVFSVYAQTKKADEIIIVYDGFNKPTFYPNTKTILNEKTVGIAKAREQGVYLSNGNLILFLDADDCLTENYLEEMEKTIESGADVAYPDVLLWSYWSEQPRDNAFYKTPNKITKKHFERQNYIVISSLMKKKVFFEVGGFDKSLPIYEDYKFFFTAYNKGFKFKKANCYLKYRQRLNSRNRRLSEKEKAYFYYKIKKELTH